MADAEYARQHAAAQFGASVVALKRHMDNEDFDKALPLCVKALEAQPDNVIARRCRIFVLLNLSRWSDALQWSDKYKSEEDSFVFERAYCLYRLNRFQEALDVLATSAGDDTDRDKRLEAQVRYRMGDYDACASIYEGLYEENQDDNGPLVCAMASCISGDKARDAIALSKDAVEHLESSYEVCFNLACAHIEEDRLADAEQRLQDAKNLCVEELLQAEELEEEDAGKIEDHEELAAIHVQRGCVLQRREGQGDLQEATELYNRVLKQRAGVAGEVDVTVLAVACNNVVALRSEGKSLFDSLKRINVASKESLEHKLTTKQTVEIAMNKCLLLLQARKPDDAKRELQRLSEAHPGHPRVAILEAVIAGKDKKVSGSAQEVLQKYLQSHPGSEEVLLCLAQIHEQQQRGKEASEVLMQLSQESRAQPKTIEAIVALHLRQKHPDKAVACLRDAIEFWTSQADDRSEDMLASVLRTASRVAAQVSDRSFAAEVFQLYLEKVDGSDNDALCGLVQALASTNIEKAEEYADRLRVPEYSHLDPEELEASPIPKVQKVKQAAAAASAAAAAAAASGAAPAEDGSVRSKIQTAETQGQVAAKEAPKKRKKKIRYPKNYDPENPGPPPDPERWLPKHERSDYKKKMSKRNKGLLRGPQGAMVTDDNAFRKQGPSTAQVEVAKDTVTGRRNQGRKNKGKK